MVQKTDLLTGEKFLAKRIDQKFASARNRLRYNNMKTAAIRKEKSSIDKPLHENYRVLSGLLKDKKSSVFHKQFLLGKGYDFGVMTHYVNYEGKNQKAVYQFVIVDIGIDQIKIVKNG